MNENHIHTAVLIATYEHLIKTHKFLISLGAEVSALRETVAGLDPTFADVLEQKRQSCESLIAGRLSEDLTVLQTQLELLRQLGSS